MYKVSLTIANFLKISMKEWKTNLHLNHIHGSTACENLKMKYEIFQGYLFSPLLFCLALAPFSYKLKQTGYVYQTYKSSVLHGWFKNVWEK